MKGMCSTLAGHVQSELEDYLNNRLKIRPEGPTRGTYKTLLGIC